MLIIIVIRKFKFTKISTTLGFILAMKLFSCLHITWLVYRQCTPRILSPVINIKYYANSQYARILLGKKRLLCISRSYGI